MSWIYKRFTHASIRQEFSGNHIGRGDGQKAMDNEKVVGVNIKENIEIVKNKVLKTKNLSGEGGSAKKR